MQARKNNNSAKCANDFNPTVEDIKKALGNRGHSDSVHEFALRVLQLARNSTEKCEPPARNQKSRLSKLRDAILICNKEFLPNSRLSILTGAVSDACKSPGGGYPDPGLLFDRILKKLKVIDAAANTALSDIKNKKTFANSSAGRPRRQFQVQPHEIALLWKEVFQRWPGKGRDGPFAKVLGIIFEFKKSQSNRGDYARITAAAVAFAKMIDSDRCNNLKK